MSSVGIGQIGRCYIIFLFASFSSKLVNWNYLRRRVIIRLFVPSEDVSRTKKKSKWRLRFFVGPIRALTTCVYVRLTILYLDWALKLLYVLSTSIFAYFGCTSYHHHTIQNNLITTPQKSQTQHTKIHSKNMQPTEI